MVSNTAAVPVSSGAIGETLELLRPEARSKGHVRSGYVDLLGPPERGRLTPGQRLCQVRALPLIYEPLWRPVFGFFFFGRGMNAEKERRLTMEMLEVSGGDRVLDVGCGPGNYTRHLAEVSGDGLVVGLDSSDVMLTAAVKRGGRDNLAYVRGDGENLPFGDGAFDVVSCVGVIHMMSDSMNALGELVRVLAPGGRVAIVTLCAGKATPAGRGGVRMFSREELPDALIGRGMTAVTQRVVRRGQFVAARRPS